MSIEITPPTSCDEAQELLTVLVEDFHDKLSDEQMLAFNRLHLLFELLLSK